MGMGTHLRADIYMTDRLTGETRVWPEDDLYDADAFGEDGWAEYMWSDGSSGHGGNRAMFFARAGDGVQVKDAGDDRFHVKIVNRDTAEVLYDDGPDFG